MEQSHVKNLFVYGTLRKGFSRHHHLKDCTRYLGDGTIRGILYDLGEYPGAVPRAISKTVKGEIYELYDPAAQLKQLDAIEDYDPDAPEQSLFVRKLITVHVADGKKIEAWAYFLSQKPSRARVISSGDYQCR